MTALALAGTGGGLVHYSKTLPEWTDAAKAERLMEADASVVDLKGAKRDAYDDNWFRQMDALRTFKWRAFDLGSGLVALATTLAVGVLLLRTKTVSDFFNLRTPRSRILILGICALAWFWFFRSSVDSLQQNYERHMFPWWADTLGIPMAGLALIFLSGLVIMAPITWFLALRHAALPVSLWVWRQDAPMASWFFSVCAAISLLFAAACLWDTLRSGPYEMVPAIGLWSFGTVCVRAAGISRFAAKVSLQQTV